MDTVATVFSLFTVDNPGLHKALFSGLNERRLKIDGGWLADLYASCPPDLKFEITRTVAFPLLDPETFKRLFFSAWRRSPLTPLQRTSLLGTLRGFLYWNPERVEDYTEVILEGLGGSGPVRISAFGLAGYLNDLPARELLRLKRGMGSARKELRMQAHNGLCRLVKRRHEVSPAVAAFCLSPEVRAIAERTEQADPDENVRLCAHYLVKALRQARRARSGSQANATAPNSPAKKAPARNTGKPS